MILFYAKLIDLPGVRRYYPSVYEKLASGEDIKFDRYFKDDFSAKEIIKVNNEYHIVIEKRDIGYIDEEDKDLFKNIDTNQDVNKAYIDLCTLRQNKSKDIDKLLSKANDVIAEAEKISQDYDIDFEWTSKIGVYSEGEWNTSSLSC